MRGVASPASLLDLILIRLEKETGNLQKEAKAYLDAMRGEELWPPF